MATVKKILHFYLSHLHRLGTFKNGPLKTHLGTYSNFWDLDKPLGLLKYMSTSGTHENRWAVPGLLKLRKDCGAF